MKLFAIAIATTLLCLPDITQAEMCRLDAGFGDHGRTVLLPTTSSGRMRTVASRSDAQGRFVVAALGRATGPIQYSFVAARFLANGQADATFGDNGVASIQFPSSVIVMGDLALAPDGGVVLAGVLRDLTESTLALAKFDDQGQPESAFGTNGVARFSCADGTQGENYLGAIEFDGAGRILVGGRALSMAPTVARAVIARLSGAGQLDSSFDGDGCLPITDINGTAFAPPLVDDLAIDSAGRIVAAGSSLGGWVLRMSSEGVPDSGFGGNGIVFAGFSTNSNTAAAMAIDGSRIWLAQTQTTMNNLRNFGLARFTSTGILDTSLGGVGRVVLSPANDPGRDESLYGLVVRTGGGVALSGFSVPKGALTDGEFAVMRVADDGTPDNSGCDAYGRYSFDLVPDGFQSAESLHEVGGRLTVIGSAALISGADFANGAITALAIRPDLLLLDGFE